MILLFLYFATVKQFDFVFLKVWGLGQANIYLVEKNI